MADGHVTDCAGYLQLCQDHCSRIFIHHQCMRYNNFNLFLWSEVFFLSQLTKLVINVFCSIPVYLYIHINVLFKCGFVLDRKKKQNPELTGSQWTTASGNFIDGQLYSHNFYCKNLIFKSLYLPLEILSPETVLQQKLVWKHF